MFSETLIIRFTWMITLILYVDCVNTEALKYPMKKILFTTFMLSRSLYNLKHVSVKK